MMNKKLAVCLAVGLLAASVEARQFVAEDFHKAMVKAKSERTRRRWKGNCLRESTNTLRILAGKQAVKAYHRTFFSAPCTYSIAGARRPQRYLPKPKGQNFRLYSDFVWCEAGKSPTGREGWFLVTHGRFARYKGGFVEGKIGDQVYIAEGVNEGGRGFCLRHSIIFVGGEKGKAARYVCSLSSNPKGEPLRRFWGRRSYRGQLIHQVRRYHNLFARCSANSNVCPSVPSAGVTSAAAGSKGLSLLGSLAGASGASGAASGSKGGTKVSLASKEPGVKQPSPFDMGLDDWLEPGIPEEKDEAQPAVMNEDDPFYEGLDDDDCDDALLPLPDSWRQGAGEGGEGGSEPSYCSYEDDGGNWDLEPEYDDAAFDDCAF